MNEFDADEIRRNEIANCYRICRNYQDYGAKTVLSKLRQFFEFKRTNEIAELIIEVEKLTSQSSKPIGC